MTLSFKTSTSLNEALKYHEQFSKDGHSLICAGAAIIRTSSNYEKLGIFRIDKDEYIEEYKKLSNAVHKNNINIIIDLIHPGILIKSGIEQIYSPSNVIHPISKVNSEELTKDDILQI